MPTHPAAAAMAPSLITRARPSLARFGPRRLIAQTPSLVATRAPSRATSVTHLQPLHPTTVPARHITTTAPIRAAKMSTSTRPNFSAGLDPAAAEAALAPLLTANGGRWSLTPNGEALEREFKFKTFAKTWDFMTAVSLQCKLKNHHPEWSNVFNTTFIRWTTHHPKGLSAQDLELAGACDSLARDFGEVVAAEPQPTPEGKGDDEGKGGEACGGLAGLADRAVTGAGDCCVPKKEKKMTA